jgi:hypothetical protein
VPRRPTLECDHVTNEDVMSEARIRMSLADATIEIEGSESFVTAQVEKFGASIRAGLPKAADGGDGQADADARLSAVFEPTATGVAILSEIPGNSVAEKMATAGKLVAYGAAKLKNRRSVRFAEVTAVCKAHRCYDPNLSTVLRSQRTALVVGGHGRQLTISLTEDGVKEVERMIPTLGARAPFGNGRNS